GHDELGVGDPCGDAIGVAAAQVQTVGHLAQQTVFALAVDLVKAHGEGRDGAGRAEPGGEVTETVEPFVWQRGHGGTSFYALERPPSGDRFVSGMIGVYPERLVRIVRTRCFPSWAPVYPGASACGAAAALGTSLLKVDE